MIVSRLFWTVLEEWTRPKSDEIAAFTHLRTLNQGNKTLSSYIQEVRRVVDLCNFVCVGDCKDITVVDLDISQKYACRGQTIKIVRRLQSST